MKHLTGVEAERDIVRAAALRIIGSVIEVPPLKVPDSRRDWLAPPPLSVFKRMEPLGFGLPNESWWIFNPSECTPDVLWPLNTGTVVEEAGEEGTLTLQKYATALPRDVRGYASRFSPYMLRSDVAMNDRGRMATAAGLWSWVGGNWVDAQNRTAWTDVGRDQIPTKGSFNKSDSNQPRLVTAIALKQRYEWAVSVGVVGCPSVRFKTDPTGIKEIFKIRDHIGSDRRAALMTWITDHWRQDRKDEDVEIYVRKHLRGATEFSWRGMECEVLPSQYDIDKRNELIVARDAMRGTGKDRRQSR